MRSKKELYKIILNEYRKETSKVNVSYDRVKNYFICNHIRKIYNYGLITIDEFTSIMDDFQTNKPSEELHEEFLNKDMWHGNDAWWWLSYQGELRYGINIRITFLEKMVRIQDAILE